MLQSKLIDLLKSLNKKEFRNFEKKFVNNPLFNTNDKVSAMFGFFKKYYPDFENENLTKEFAFKKIFGSQTLYNRRKITYLMSDLSLLAEKYLLWIELERQPIEQKHLMAKAFRARNMDKYYFQDLENLKKLLEEQTERNTDYYYHQYYINHLIFSHPSFSKLQKNDTCFTDMLQSLEIFYCSLILKYEGIAINRKDILGEEHSFLLLDSVIEALPQKLLSKNPLPTIYYQLIVALTDLDYKDFPSFMLNVYQHIHIFDKNDQLNLLTSLVNCCIKRHHEGQEQALRWAFEVYKFGLKEMIWLEKNLLDTHHYNTVFTIGMILKEYEWIEKFINQFSNYLPETTRNNTKYFELARLNFEKKQYENALKILANFQPLNVYDTLNYKVLQLRCYYEMQDAYFDEIERLLESFNKYLQRKPVKQQLSKELKESYLNFVKFVKRLFEAVPSAVTKQKLAQELKNTKNIEVKQWLLEKLEEL